MMSSFFGRGGRREESQNDSESLSNDANPSTISTPETEGRINQMQAELEAKDAKIREQNSVIVQLRNEVESMDDLKSLNTSLQESIASKDEKIVDFDQTKFFLQAKLENNKAKIADQKKLLHYQQEAIDSKNSLIDQLRNEVESKNDLKSSNSSLQAAIVAKDEKIIDLEATKSSLQADLVDRNAKIAELNSRSSQLQREMESKSAQVEELQKELESTKSFLQEAIATNASHVKNNESLTKSVETLKEVKESLTKSVESLREVKKNQQITEPTIRASFTDISKLTNKFVFSPSTTLAGIEWKVLVQKKNDHLGVYLEGKKPNEDKWSCPVFYDLQLISQKDEKIIETGPTLNYTFNEKNCKSGYGFPKFISFKDLLDEEKGFVKDDSILVSAYLRAFPSQ